MVQNFPGPYELRLSYTTVFTSVPLTHTARYNVDLTAVPTPGDSFTNINAKTRGGTATPDLATAMEAWLTLLAARHNTGAVFGVIELWSYVPLTFDAVFISAYSPTIVAGSSATAEKVAGQETYTLRTMEGGIMRLVGIETIVGTNDRVPYPTTTPSVDAIFDFVRGATNWMLARDTSYPFAALNFLGGQNEKTFRQRFR
jgi:hypothetical protein